MDIAATGKGYALRDMREDACRLPNLVSNRGRMILEGVERSMQPDTAGAPDPLTAIWGKAKNLNVALPPVNAEIERMNKLRAKLSDRVDMAQVMPTTLGDVISSNEDPAYVQSVGTRRGVSASLLRKVHEIEQTIEKAPTSQLTHWIAEAQKFRKEEESTEEQTKKAATAAAEATAAAAGAAADAAGAMNEAQLGGLVTTINMSLRTIEAIRATLLGEKSYQELRVAKETDIKEIASKLFTPQTAALGEAGGDPTPAKTMVEYLEEMAESLKADLFLWVDDIRRNPKSYTLVRDEDGPQTAEALLDAQLDRKNELPDTIEMGDSDEEAKSQGSDDAVDFNKMADDKMGALLDTARADGGHFSGIYDAAQKAGISLSDDQVKEILKEFYKLQNKHHMTLPQRRKQKIRAERRYIETLMREDSQVKKLLRQVRELRDELAAAEEENERLLQTIQGYKGGHWEAGELRERFGKERSLVETMSNKRVKELEGKVAQMEAEFVAAVSTNEDSAGLYSKLKTDYDGLLQLVESMRAEWLKTEEEMAAKQREIEMLRLGRSRDDQLWRSRVLELSKAIVSTVTVLPPVLALAKMGCDAADETGEQPAAHAQQQQQPRPRLPGGADIRPEFGAHYDSRPSTRGDAGAPQAAADAATPTTATDAAAEQQALSFASQLQAGVDSLGRLIETTTEFSPLESLKVQLMEIQEFYDEIIPRSPRRQLSPSQRRKLKQQEEGMTEPLRHMRARPVGTWHEFVTDPEYVHKRLIETLQERIEMLATENRGKYREARYMKNMVTHACTLAESIVNGTPMIPADGLGDKTGHPFPAAQVVAQDRDYAYFWCDERKLLEETLNNLNLFFRHGGTKPNSVNSLITVIGSWREHPVAGDEEKKESVVVRRKKSEHSKSMRKAHSEASGATSEPSGSRLAGHREGN